MLHRALAIHHKGMRDARDMSCCHEHLSCSPVWVHDHLQQRQGTWLGGDEFYAEQCISCAARDRCYMRIWC